MRGKDEEVGRGRALGRPVRSPAANALWLLAGVCILVVICVRRLSGPGHPDASGMKPSETEELSPSGTPVRAEAPLPVAPRAPTVEENALPVTDEQQIWKDILGCWDRKACPEGTVCWMGDDGHLGCFKPNCRSVEDREKKCGPGQACLPVSKMASIYRCIASGPIPLGGSCLDPMIATASRNCQPGLICVNTLCRAPCDPVRSTCAADEVCVQQTVRDWACMPGCLDDAACVGGKACIHRNGAARGTCVSVPEGTCRPDRPGSCPPGQACDYSIVDGRMLAGFCRPACRASDCPSGFICWAGFDMIPDRNASGVCLQTCGSDGQGCPIDQVCMALDDNGATWGCRRAFHDARPAIDVTAARGSFTDPVAAPR